MENEKSNGGKVYWKGLAEYRQDPAFLAQQQEEFLAKPQAFFEAAEQGSDFEISRRDMLKLGGAAMVFAAASCARRPAEKIVPYLNAPEEIIPGKPVYYSSTCGSCAAGCGIHVKTREGRPIKLEGNPSHPVNQGKLCARGQASILDLYDPDRARNPFKVFRSKTAPEKIDWKTADSEIAFELRTAKKRIVLLTGTIHGPARTSLIADFVSSIPNASHVVYEPLSEEDRIQSQEVCYQTKVLPRYRFDRAETVVLLGSDPLGAGFSKVEFARGFGSLRKIRNKNMSKIICFEPALSLTGTNADLHYLVKPQDVLKVALGIACVLAVVDGRSEYAKDSQVADFLKKFYPPNIEKEVGLPAGTIRQVADELWDKRGESLVYAGTLASQTEESRSLHIIANFLNSILENDGRTVDYKISPSQQAAGSSSQMLELIGEMNAGKVDVLFIYGVNPAYSLPVASGFAAALGKVKAVVSFNDRMDETSSLADYLLPSTHYLEEWGDAEPQKGLYGLLQPAIGKLHDNRGWEESLLSLAHAARAGKLGSWQVNWYDYLREVWKTEIHQKNLMLAGFEQFWTSAVREGMFDTVDRRNDQSAPRKFNPQAIQKVNLPTEMKSELNLVLYSPSIQKDGSANNNAWLMETPDPVSKICWDNFAAVAPRTAEKLNWQEGQIVSLTVSGKTSEIPIHIQPGVHPEVVAVAVGWGREKAGRVGNKVGVNAFQWAAVKDKNLQYSALPVQIQTTSKIHKLANVQLHHNMLGRPIIFETTLPEYQKDPKAGIEPGHELVSLWSEHEYAGHKWGMAVDLNSCIGCNACMLACQAENNIPIVGREQVVKGREMSWIRIDSYYSENPEHPDVTHHPMLCQHCDNAPCETVCPVVATLHSDEGLNLQIYNRCVGTRYCSNNCPYKVRRFNWYENNQNLATPLDLVLNPDVTVREKGVMEKCTFCIQRIRYSKEEAKQDGRPVKDGEIKTACQQTCPTDAIVFGDLNNPDSKVSRLAGNPRGYHVLRELNTRPVVTYLSKVRNRKEDSQA